MWTVPWWVVQAATVADGHGQVVSDTPPRADTVELLVVNERSWTPAVAVTLSFAGGYGDDPPGAEGTAWLLGMVLARAANANLAETGATAQIEVGAGRAWVTLLATGDEWATAYRILTRTLQSDPVDSVLAEAARADLLAQLVFEHGSPVRSFELETQRMLLGPEHRAARSPNGSSSSVGGGAVAALEAARARTYRPEGSRVAVAGAVTPAEAAAVVGAHRTRVTRAEGVWVVEGTPPSPVARGPAWESGGRQAVADEITNSWIVAAYPFPGTAGRGPLEFLAHVVRDRLVTDPPAPGLISHRVEVRELPDGPVLVVTVAAESHAIPAWERRVEEVVGRLSADPLALELVDRLRRSFRSLTALERAAPERENRRLLVETEATGQPAELPAAPAQLSPAGLQRTAAQLGEPRVLVYGRVDPGS